MQIVTIDCLRFDCLRINLASHERMCVFVIFCFFHFHFCYYLFLFVLLYIYAFHLIISLIFYLICLERNLSWERSLRNQIDDIIVFFRQLFWRWISVFIYHNKCKQIQKLIWVCATYYGTVPYYGILCHTIPYYTMLYFVVHCCLERYVSYKFKWQYCTTKLKY